MIRGMAGRTPYSRGQFNRALIVNALADPFNIVLLAAILIAGIVLGAVAYVAPVAVIAYLAGVARTYFDEDTANRVLEGERAGRRGRVAQRAGRRGRVAQRARPRPEDFEPAIGRLLHGARTREARIRDAIERADLPYDEVAVEVDRFVAAMDQTATRAQLLAEALADNPPPIVERRLDELRARDDPAKAGLIDALESQLDASVRMQRQLDHFHAEMERMLVELDTVRSQIVSVSATTEGAEQAQLATEVRALRERMGAVADGMEAAYGGQR